jgi:uncharacterized protein (TIGR00645 family)
MRALEHFIEAVIFNSRWLLAPFFLGLIVAILVLLVKFFKQLADLVSDALTDSSAEQIITILTLVDTALIAALLIMIILSGYESFVSRIEYGDEEERPSWMGKVGFGGLKLKLISALVAISAVELLKLFLQPGGVTTEEVLWRVGIHLTFAVSGVLFAVTDYIAGIRK